MSPTCALFRFGLSGTAAAYRWLRTPRGSGGRPGEGTKHVPDRPVVRVAIEASRPGILERVGVVAQPRPLAGCEIHAADVIDGHDGLHQDVFPDDTILTLVVPATAVALLARHGDVFAQGQLVDVEGRIDAYAAALQLAERGRAVLLEIV